MKKLLFGVILAGVVGLSGNLSAAESFEAVRDWCGKHEGEQVEALSYLVCEVLDNEAYKFLAETSDNINDLVRNFDCRNKPENAPRLDTLIRVLDDFLASPGDFLLKEKLPGFLDKIGCWCNTNAGGLTVGELRGLLGRITDNDRVDYWGAHNEIQALVTGDGVVRQDATQDMINDLCKALQECLEEHDDELGGEEHSGNQGDHQG